MCSRRPRREGHLDQGPARAAPAEEQAGLQCGVRRSPHSGGTSSCHVLTRNYSLLASDHVVVGLGQADAVLRPLQVTSSGAVYTWGCDDDKALGRPGPEGSPVIVDDLRSVAVLHSLIGDLHEAVCCGLSF
jgi:hypothetical protein